MRIPPTDHLDIIIDQFTRQSIPFTQIPGHFSAIDTLLRMSAVTADDTVLDVACGPGIVACELARHARSVTGVDITPGMLQQARQRQRQQGLSNVQWQEANAVQLPFAADTFSLVVTRYSFHHLQDVQQALREMMRVCAPGGRVLVADVVMPDEQAAAYDELETLRDPSHTHALSTSESLALFASSGLTDCRFGTYEVEIELEAQLAASFPAEEDVPRIRRMVTDDIGINRLGIHARRDAQGQVHYTVPIRVYVGRKAHATDVV